jgi:threonine aldolase
MTFLRPASGLLLPLALLMGALLVLPACAPAGETTQRSARGPLTAAEIETAGIRGTALEVVRNLRAEWLNTRTGGDIRVYVDGARFGNTAASLGSISAQNIGRMERLSANAASTRFGSGAGGHPEGAIVITTTR